MPPQLALALTLILIGYLYRREFKVEPRVSSASWIPVLWLMINSSRQVSQWIYGTGGVMTAELLEEGTPIDKVVYSGLIFVGVCILAKRRVRVVEVVSNNPAVMLLVLYAGISVLWSDFGVIAFKRWVKVIGDLVMVLILCSDPLPMRAITSALKRCAYVLIPLSILFVKYYQHLGRIIDPWGNSYYTGVATDKNMFGYLLFAFGLFFTASLMSRFAQPRDDRKRLRIDQMIDIVLLLMIVWLLPVANSKTALLSLIIGVAILLASRVPAVQRHFWAYAVTGILLVAVSDATFSLKGQVLQASGRDESFTGRTGIWETVLNEQFNPVVGTGYASFWLGERLERIWRKYPRTPLIQAHNGYIEVYINLGLIGLLLLVSVLVTGLRRARRRMSAPDSGAEGYATRVIATFGTPYCIAYLFYNWTEATFTAMNLLFLIFIVLAFEYRQAREARRVLVPVATKGNGQLAPQSLEPRQRVFEHRRKWGYR